MPLTPLVRGAIVGLSHVASHLLSRAVDVLETGPVPDDKSRERQIHILIRLLPQSLLIAFCVMIPVSSCDERRAQHAEPKLNDGGGSAIGYSRKFDLLECVHATGNRMWKNVEGAIGLGGE